jgi:hypothetical protein
MGIRGRVHNVQRRVFLHKNTLGIRRGTGVPSGSRSRCSAGFSRLYSMGISRIVRRKVPTVLFLFFVTFRHYVSLNYYEYAKSKA